MCVAEKKRCDPSCHPGSGCSEHGEDKCDSYCVTGYGIDPSDYTCMSECDLVARRTSDNLHVTYIVHCLQCFDAVGRAVGRASGL